MTSFGYLSIIGCIARNSGGTCREIQGQCWCYVNRGTLPYSVCGFSAGYNGAYYSLATNSQPSPWTIIKGLGQKPHRQVCPYDTKDGCDNDCGVNDCSGSGPGDGCWGTSLTCLTDEYRWKNTKNPSIVRCSNME